MIAFDTEGQLIIKTSMDAETYAYTLNGLVTVLDILISKLSDDVSISPVMFDAIGNTFDLLKDMLPNADQTQILDIKTKRITLQSATA
jgi:hypothetical protein